MAKIIKVGSQNITPNKIANPFRTSRNSTTNPFKYNNFEGTTLPLELAADVFAGTKTEKPNRLKMIATSVTGSMNKMRSSIAEPIVNFVNRVRGGISHAWDYAKNTNIEDLPGIKQFNDVMNTDIVDLPGVRAFGELMATPVELHLPSIKGLSDSMASLREGISSKMEFLNTDVTEIAKGMSEKWAGAISKIHTRKINAEMPVAELEQLWKNEIELGGVVA